MSKQIAEIASPYAYYVSSNAREEYLHKIAFEDPNRVNIYSEAGLLSGGWENVIDHCGRVALRALKIGQILHLPDEVNELLFHAGLLHDAGKKIERETTRGHARPGSWESDVEASEKVTKFLQSQGVQSKVIELINAVAGQSIVSTEELLRKTEFTDYEWAKLILHLMDDSTIGGRESQPAMFNIGNDKWGEIILTSDSEKKVRKLKELQSKENWIINNWGLKNDLARRLEGNSRNPNYKKANEEGIELFGVTTPEAMYRISKRIERILAQQISQVTGREIQPELLLEYVDACILADVAAWEKNSDTSMVSLDVGSDSG